MLFIHEFTENVESFQKTSVNSVFSVVKFFEAQVL
jgi:hypothetical protein